MAAKSTIHIKKSNRGKLHRALGVKPGDKIPASKLRQAANSSSPQLRKEAQFAINAKRFNH